MRKFTLILTCLGLLCNNRRLLAQTDILTQHNDLRRSGWNNQETKLNPNNVKAGPFAKLFTCAVDDQIFAQPLVATGINLPATGIRNLVLTATVNNSVYAFDADSARSAPYWHYNYTPAGTRPPRATDMTGACGGNYHDFSGSFGIVGTPVIDKTTLTLYVVTRHVTTDGTNVYSQYLHALDITTGAEKTGSPVLITASVNGHGGGNVNGVISFDPQKENQRPGLLLLNGIVYIGWASHCDWSPYHGWLLGYDAATLQQKIVYNDTPEGWAGGIWMSASAPSVDDAGNIFVTTGNGTSGVGTNVSDLTNRGESLLKLTPSGGTLQVLDFFTPDNNLVLDNADLDFGVTEPLIIPGANRVLAGCKDGHLFLANTNDLGGYSSTADNVVQTIDLGASAHLHSSFGYYKGTAKELIYTWSENSVLKAFPFDRVNGILDTVNVIISGLQGPVGNSGANISVSSNGSVDSTAILWVSHAINCDAQQGICPGMLRAIRANDVTQELWNSTLETADSVGLYTKFSCPSVANGKVYLATLTGKLLVYGLTNNGIDTCNSPNIAQGQPATASSAKSAATAASYAVDGNLSTMWSSMPTHNEFIYADLGKSFDLCRMILYWGPAFGMDFNIDVSQDASTWTTIDSIRSNSSLINNISLHGSGRYVRMRGINPGTVASGYSIEEMQVYGTPTVTCFAPAGLTAGNLTPDSVLISWQPVGNASGYTVQYKAVSDANWNTVTTNSTSIELRALSCRTDYLYQVATNCSASRQSAWSASNAFSTPPCAVVCNPLPTRWTTSDIGNVGIAGSACYNGTMYSLQGSGADIGGTADAFRFAYVTLAADEQFVTRIVTQDASDPDNKMGLMIRESSGTDSRNAFIGLTSGLGGVFQYRNTTGGPTTSLSVTSPAVPAAPWWVRLIKQGSLYQGAFSADGLSWTNAGPAVDLGFGAGTSTLAGFAITSHNNTLLSSATADNYSETSVVLPVQLLSFTGQNMNGSYVALRWSTASEQNSSQFTVERSQDGVHFSGIITVKAAGNSVTPQVYTAEDHQPGLGVNYYRLRETDLDGRFIYSPIILVRFGTDPAPLLFPNPASSIFTLLPGKDPIRSVSLFDLSGRQLMRLYNGAASSVLTISCGSLAGGIYIVQIQTATQTWRQKLVKR